MADALKPAQIVSSMIELGWAKTTMPVGQLLVRSGLAGALLGVATTLAFAATTQTGLPIVGALIFPVGFAMIVVLGLDLVTGSFALLPMAVMAGRATVRQMLVNWAITFVGNFIGALILAVLMYVVLTSSGHDTGGPIGDKLRAAVAAPLGWLRRDRDRRSHHGVRQGDALQLAGLPRRHHGDRRPHRCRQGDRLLVADRDLLRPGVRAYGRHMSLFPLGLMMGAKATIAEYLLANELPVTIGNIFGGFLFTGLALYLAYQNREARVAPMPDGRAVMS